MKTVSQESLKKMKTKTKRKEVKERIIMIIILMGLLTHSEKVFHQDLLIIEGIALLIQMNNRGNKMKKERKKKSKNYLKIQHNLQIWRILKLMKIVKHNLKEVKVLVVKSSIQSSSKVNYKKEKNSLLITRKIAAMIRILIIN